MICHDSIGRFHESDPTHIPQGKFLKIAQQEPPLAGSSVWTGGDEYQDEYAVRIKRFLETFNQEAI
jgi:hypothetical protein